MRKYLFAFGVVAAVAVITPAIAQEAISEPPIGSRLGNRLKPTKQHDERAAALGAHEFARCIVNKRTRAVREALASTDPDSLKKVNSAAHGDLTCMNAMLAANDSVEGRRVTFPPDLMRGMLAEYLIKSGEAAVRQLPALPRQQIYKRPWFGATQRHIAVDEMASCVSEVDPAATLAILKTEPYSAAERQAFTAITSVMGPCLTAGAKLHANRQALRAALAEALYQRTQPWAIVPPQPTAPAAPRQGEPG